jgi:hypothetical protein
MQMYIPPASFELKKNFFLNTPILPPPLPIPLKLSCLLVPEIFC